MNILNQLFGKIYIISSYPTYNRLSTLINFLNDENIKYELVIAPKKKYFKPDYEKTLVNESNQSLISANESIFLKEKIVESESFCVIEDDIYFDKNYHDKLISFSTDLPNDWEILNLGYHKNTPVIYNQDLSYYKLKQNEEIVGTHIVVYRKNVVDFLLSSIETCIYPMDWFLTKQIYSNFNTYICTNKIFYASSYREYESDKNEFYKKYKSEIF